MSRVAYQALWTKINSEFDVSGHEMRINLLSNLCFTLDWGASDPARYGDGLSPLEGHSQSHPPRAGLNRDRRNLDIIAICGDSIHIIALLA
jgi:hypothetical protein